MKFSGTLPDIMAKTLRIDPYPTPLGTGTSALPSSPSHLRPPDLNLGLDDDLKKKYRHLFGGGPPPPPPGGGGAVALPKGILIELPDECFEESGGPASSESLLSASQAQQRNGKARRTRTIRAEFPLFAGADVAGID